MRTHGMRCIGRRVSGVGITLSGCIQRAADRSPECFPVRQPAAIGTERIDNSTAKWADTKLVVSEGPDAQKSPLTNTRLR
jgi:hypothetical protein